MLSRARLRLRRAGLHRRLRPRARAARPGHRAARRAPSRHGAYFGVPSDAHAALQARAHTRRRGRRLASLPGLRPSRALACKAVMPRPRRAAQTSWLQGRLRAGALSGARARHTWGAELSSLHVTRQSLQQAARRACRADKGVPAWAPHALPPGARAFAAEEGRAATAVAGRPPTDGETRSSLLRRVLAAAPDGGEAKLRCPRLAPSGCAGRGLARGPRLCPRRRWRRAAAVRGANLALRWPLTVSVSSADGADAAACNRCVPPAQKWS
jgi:hypothetical protein